MPRAAGRQKAPEAKRRRAGHRAPMPGAVSAAPLSVGESSDAFARIDLVSNHTVFADAEYYWALMRGEALPVETYSSFIHEATHHWCFISPLGTALSLLYLSVAKKALRWACTGDEAKFNETLDDFFVFQAAIKWLRPLSEGLAQFAEYDVLPPESAALTSPPTYATLLHLFNLPQRIEAVQHADPTPAYYKLSEDITRWRLSRRSVERKSELLLQPVGDEIGAYLLGYLTVKHLWRSARRFYDELKDADLFMMFLRKLVYGDYALVAELLDRGKPARQRAIGFGKALYERLYAVRNVFFDEDVPWSEWENILATPDVDHSIPLFGVADGPAFAAMDTAELVAAGREFQGRFFREVAEPLDFDLKPIPIFPPDYFFDVLKERHLMGLGEVPAQWRPTGPRKGQVVVNGEVLYDNYQLVEAPDDAVSDGELQLDIYIDLYGNYQVTTIGNRRGVFGFATRHAGEKTYAQLTKLRLDRRMIDVTTNAIHTLIAQYVGRSNFHQVIGAFWQDGGHELFEMTYRGYAFNFDEAAEKAISERGTAELLENDPDLVRSVAAITLAASAGLSPEGLQSFAEELPIAPAETIRRVKALWPIKNLPLAALDEDGFLDSAF